MLDLGTDMFKVFIEAINDFVTLLASIFGIVSFIDGISDLNPLITKYSSYIKILLSFLLLSIVLYRSITRNVFVIQYRIKEDKMALDLSINLLKLKKLETIELTITKENDNSKWLNFLAFFLFDTYLKLEFPMGINAEMEKDHTDFQMVRNEDKTQSKLAQASLKLTGRRKVNLYISLDDMTNFEGEDYIYLKIYIAPKYKYVRKLIKFKLCNQPIKILPKGA